MKHLKRCMIIGIIFVLSAGTLSHFLFEWSDCNFVVGLFTPVNESVWEHMKLLFFPMLAYTPIPVCRFRRQYPCILSAMYFGLLSGTLLIPLLYYAYTGIIGKNIFVLDIGIFLLSIVTAFWLACRLTLSRRLKSYTVLLCILTGLLVVCFIAFTYRAPELTLFIDPSKKG